MSGTGFVRMAKLVGTGIVLAAARHNRRAIHAEAHAGGSIDPARSHLNYRLAGSDSPEEVAGMASSRVKAAGLSKLRKDAVRAIELVFSLPVTAEIEHQAYFADCLRWAADRLGGIVLSADVHLDESAPHCHVLILPLIGNRMVGSELVGGRQVLAGHLTSFQESVAGRYGLRRPPPRLSTSDRRALAAAVLQRLRELDDAALRSATWAVVRDAIERDPVPWASTLGVSVTARRAKPMKSMTDIFTSTGKGPKKEREPSNPIGFDVGAEDRTLCSVGFGSETASATAPGSELAEVNSVSVTNSVSTESTSAPNGPPGSRRPSNKLGAQAQRMARPAQLGLNSPLRMSSHSRVRESERTSSAWCGDRGEFIDAPQPARLPTRRAAEAWVASRLSGAR